jgi:hypothetical protein
LCLFGGFFGPILLSRKLEPSSARSAIILANVIGFAAVAANDSWGGVRGDARGLARIFVILHVAFTLAFAVFARLDSRRRTGEC